MKTSLFLALILAAIGASVATSVVILAEGPDDPTKSEASEALRPDQVVKLPAGQSASNAPALPYDYGRFRIVSPDADYHYCQDHAGLTRTDQETTVFTGGDEGATQATSGSHRIMPVSSLTSLRSNRLFKLPSFMPAGWTPAYAEALSITWSDGTNADTNFSVRYEKPKQFYISVRRFLIPPDCRLEVTDLGRAPASLHAVTLSSIEDVPVVIRHQAPGKKVQAVLQVTFIEGDVVTTVESVASDLDDLINIARSMIKDWR